MGYYNYSVDGLTNSYFKKENLGHYDWDNVERPSEHTRAKTRAKNLSVKNPDTVFRVLSSRSYVPTTYFYDGKEYSTLDDAIAASNGKVSKDRYTYAPTSIENGNVVFSSDYTSLSIWQIRVNYSGKAQSWRYIRVFDRITGETSYYHAGYGDFDLVSEEAFETYKENTRKYYDADNLRIFPRDKSPYMSEFHSNSWNTNTLGPMYDKLRSVERDLSTVLRESKNLTVSQQFEMAHVIETLKGLYDGKNRAGN